jgi:hypothetical protein
MHNKIVATFLFLVLFFGGLAVFGRIGSGSELDPKHNEAQDL